MVLSLTKNEVFEGVDLCGAPGRGIVQCCATGKGDVLPDEGELARLRIRGGAVHTGDRGSRGGGGGWSCNEIRQNKNINIGTMTLTFIHSVRE